MKISIFKSDLQPLFDLVLKTIPLAQQERLEQDIIAYIEHILKQMYIIIEHFEDNDNPQIQRIVAIKKDKSYINRYIDSFTHMKEIHDVLGNKEQKRFSALGLYLFKSFQHDTEATLNAFGEANTFLLAYPDVKKKAMSLMGQKQLSPKQQNFLQTYNMYKSISQYGKFFEGYHVSRKIIVTSTSIFLYRSLLELPNMKKYTLKEVLETVFMKIEETVKIYPEKMDEIYLKTVFGAFPIFAYPAKNEKRPYVDLNRVAEILEGKIERQLEKGNLSEVNRLKKYFEGVVNPLKNKLLG